MILLRLIGVFFDLLLLPLRLLRRGALIPRDVWLTLTVDGPVVDIIGRTRFWQFRAQKALSLHRLDEAASEMMKDPRVKGLVLTIRSMTAGMASATSLRGILERVCAAGKQVVVHLPRGGDNKEVYVASAANNPSLGPATQLAPLGFRSSAHYVKRALDRAGIEPQVFACGEFKAAGETLVRDTMSAGQREQVDRMLDSFHHALI